MPAAAEVTFTVDTDGGTGYDYFTLSDCVDNEVDYDLPATGASGEQVTIRCRSSAGTADTAAVTIPSTVTTSADSYVKIWTDPTDTGDDGGLGVGGTHRHDGKWNTSAYRLVGAGKMLSVPFSSGAAAMYMRVVGLQIMHDGHTSAGIHTARTSSDSLLVDQCIVFREGAGASWHNSVYNVYMNLGAGVIRNSVLSCPRGPATGALWANVYSNTATISAYNCTVVNSYVGFGGSASARFVIKNNLAFGHGSACYSSTPTYDTADYNGSDDASAPGTNTIDTTSVDFENYTGSSSGDCHLSADDTVAFGAGDDLSATFTWDIDDDTRVNWSIGADDGPSGGTDQLIAGSATAATDADLALTVDSVISGSATAATDADASITVGNTIAGSATAATDADASLTVDAVIAGSATATTDADATLTVARPVAGSATATTDADATLTIAKVLAGSATAATDADLTLTVARIIAGSATAATDADLTLYADTTWLDALYVSTGTLAVLDTDTRSATADIIDLRNAAVEE